MPVAARGAVFFLARHPLKVVGCLVALALAIALHSASYPGQATHVRIHPVASRGDLYAYPLEVNTKTPSATLSELRERLPKAHLITHSFPTVLLVQRHPEVHLSSPLPDGTRLVTMTAFTQLVTLIRAGRRSEVAIFSLGILGVAYTIITLFRDFRRLGSMFSLGCVALLTTGMDLLFGLALLRSGGFFISPLLLLEFGPYFIMAVGFRKSHLLAKRIYEHRRSKGDTMGLLCGVEASLKPLATEYALEIGLFALFALSDVRGLREFSLLCVLMLLTDALLLFTFFLGLVAFRLRLHAKRAETLLDSNGTFTGYTTTELWSKRAKLVATIILLGLYSLNLLRSLSASIDGAPRYGQMISQVEQALGEQAKDSTIYVFPTIMVTDTLDAGRVLSPGAIQIFKEIINRILPAEGVTSLERILQVCISLALPISLVANYYLFLVLRKYRRLTGKESNDPQDDSETLVIHQKPKLPITAASATDDELVHALQNGRIPLYALESHLPGDTTRAVRVRRQFLTLQQPSLRTLHSLPWEGFDYDAVKGRNCENVIGYVPVPVGIAGPLLVDGVSYYVPLSTTEGALVASTSRGMKALTYGGGVRTALLADGMARGPVISLPTLAEAVKVITWIRDNFAAIAQVFNETSKYTCLQKVDSKLVGRLIYLRFKATTGDAMGMNMVSKATEHALALLNHQFPALRIIALSGNYCTDKKPAAINWIDGRGKSIVAEATIANSTLKGVLKTDIDAIMEAHITKNLVGSALAGASGSGCNAHAANIVAAMFIALGQDVAHVVSSSACLLHLEPLTRGSDDLYVALTMPSLEVGTVGGGTMLPAQRACLSLLGLEQIPEGGRSTRVASIVAATVMAAELSLLASLTEGSLMRAHQALNRRPQ